MSDRILVTGGAGFIGSHLVRRLIREGAAVTVLDDLSTGSEANLPGDAELVRGDITDPAALDRLDWPSFNAVCHLAAQSSGALSFQNPEKDMRGHVLGTFLLLERCRAYQVPGFVYASSSTIYGEPESLPVDETHALQPTMFYSAGKQAAENYVRFFSQFGTAGTILRMPNVYGPGQNLANRMQGMVSIYLAYMLEGEPVLVKGGLDRVRDFIYIDDVVDAWLLALKRPADPHRTYNLGSGTGVTVGQMLDELRRAWGDPDYPVRLDANTPGDQSAMILDTRRIREELGFAPKHGLEAGLRLMVEQEKRRTDNGF